MDCQQARALLHAELDEELDSASQAELGRHLASCAACAQAREANMALHGLIQRSDLRYRPAPGLEGRIVAAIRPANGPARSARRWTPVPASPWVRRAFAALAATAALVLASWVGFDVGHRSQAPPLADEIVDSHIRSLMPGHLTDEASSEHHTVKPWFAGRLDFSPPVPDLSDRGFTLVGGRLDYLGGRPVAALVYRRRQHVINLYVWPVGVAAPVLSGSRRGYNFVRGTSGQNEMWAVSDLNAAELAQFLDQVEQRQ